MEKENSNGRLTILLIISMILWGLSWPANKVMRSFSDPVTLGVMRYSVVILSMVPMLLLMKVRIKISKTGIFFVVISGLLMSVYNYTFLEGLHKGDSGAGGILVTTLNPIFAYTLGILLARRKPTTNETIGILLGAAAGVVLLKLWDNINILSNPSNALFLGSALLWSVMSKFTSRSKEFGNPLAFTWWMYVVTLLTLLPFVDYGTLGKLATSPEPKFWWNLMFTSVIVTSFATTMYFIATSRIGAERASSFIFTVPLCAGISALCILGEPLMWHTITGGIIGIGAVYILNKKKKTL